MVSISRFRLAIQGRRKPVPVNTGAPALTGTPATGQILTTNEGSWNNDPDGYYYKYQYGDGITPTGDIPGETTNTYQVSGTYTGDYLRVGVKAYNSGGEAADWAYSPWVGPVDNTGTMPATQTISFGDKTRRGAGGYDCQNTGGTLTIVSQVNNAASPVSLFTVDSHNKLVVAGTYGTAPPAMTAGPYSVVVNNGTDSSTVTIPIVANLWNVTNIDSGTNADTAGSNQAKTAAASAAMGDTISFRDGSIYNNVEPCVTSGPNTWVWTRNDPTQEALLATYAVASLNPDFSVNSEIPDNIWIKVTADTPGGANIRRLTLYGSNNHNFGLWFTGLNFHRSYVATNFGATDAGLIIGGGILSARAGYVRVSECSFFSTDAVVNQPSIINGIYSTRSTVSVFIHDNDFYGVFTGLSINGPLIDPATVHIPADCWIVGNTFDNCFEDHRQLTDCFPCYSLWNLSKNGKIASPSTHADAEQRRVSAATPAGTYEWGVCVGNVTFRGVGTPNSIDEQGTPFQTSLAGGLVFTNALVAGNLYIGTGGHMALVSLCTQPIVKWNSGLFDQTPGISIPSPPNYAGITYVNGIGGSALYNVMGLAIDLDGTQTPLDANTGNILLNPASSTYTAAFVDPQYGPNIVTMADALAFYRWKVGGTLDPAITGLPYQVGAVTDYIDHVNRTASFPL